MTSQQLKDIGKLAASRQLKTIRSALGSEAKLHLVGGAVRDLLAGRENYDIDLTTILHPARCSELLKSAGIRVVETGLQHGTLTIVLDNTNIELTTFRQPGDRNSSIYSDSIETDLSGRDFTINAIAFSLEQETLVDPFNGRTDLEAGLLKAVGSAEDRIIEDPLRILRMVRFGPAENRSVDSSLENAVKKHVSKLELVSVERIKAELQKILVSLAPAAALCKMLELDLIEQILPEMLPGVGFEQNEFHNEDVFGHTLTVLGKSKPTTIQRLSALFHDLGKPHTLSVGPDGRRHFYKHELESQKICQAVMKRLKFSKDETNQVSTIVSYHMRPLDCGPTGVRRLIRDLGPCLEDWLEFKAADASPGLDPQINQDQRDHFRNMVEEEKERQKGSVYGKLAVNGRDLMEELGFSEGPDLGQVLKELEQAVLKDPEQNDRETLLQLAKNLSATAS